MTAPEHWRRTLRTVIQAAVGLAAGLPVILATAGIPARTAGVGVVLAVAAAVTRVMALPSVEALLPSWLRATAPHTQPDPSSPTGTV